MMAMNHQVVENHVVDPVRAIAQTTVTAFVEAIVGHTASLKPSAKIT